MLDLQWVHNDTADLGYTKGLSLPAVRTALTVCLALALALTGLEARQNQAAGLIPFESYLEALRIQAGIPGMSAVLLQDGQIVWERGLGFQNQERRIRATPDTTYPIADMSQTIAAVLVLRCAEERQLNINDPIRRYGGSVAEADATIRQVLNHTSSGSGESFHYDPERYLQLTRVVETCILQPYRKSVAVNVLERLAMQDSVPGRDVTEANVVNERLFSSALVDRYKSALDRLATGYKVDKRGRLTKTDVPLEGINAATGLVSTVRDLARFDAALDTSLLLREETLQTAWLVTYNSQNAALPAGLGWFVQNYRGEPVVWHFGLIANAYSSLIIKLPSRKTTLILLANSDGLSAPFQLEAGDVTKSLFATLFLRLFS
jgi:CubicO group peptidase (beta-lactamase class C family)